MIADIIAQDSKGRDVLAVLVKGRHLDPEMASKFIEYMENEAPSTPFIMVVDLGKIRIKKQGHEPRADTYCELDTEDVLGRYEPEFGKKRIYHDYLVTLLEVWLGNLAYPRQAKPSPGMKELSEIGLLDRLEQGTTQREVPIGEDSLR